MNELDAFIDQFYGKYSPNDIPQGERRARLKEKLQTNFDGYVNQMYTKYAPDNLPDSTRLASLRTKYLTQAQTTPQTQEPVQQDSGMLAPWQHLVEQAQLPADPNAPKPLDAFGSAWQRGTNLAETSNLLFDNNNPDQAQLDQVAKLQQEQQAAPTSPSYAKFTQAKTFKESLQALVDNPVQVIGEIFIESIAGQAGNWKNIAARTAEGGAIGAAAGSFVVPGIGTGAGLAGGISSGVVEGMAETSLKLEWAGKFLEALQAAGVDTSNPDSLKEAFSNDEIMSKAREAAYKKAIPIAIFDLISGGVAGRIVSKPAKSLLGKIGAGAAELGVQGALGGGGELAGEVTSGEQISPSDILAEIVGEGATSPVEIVAGAHAYNQTRSIDPVMAATTEDLTPTGDVGLDGTIDAQYDEIARKMDELTFEPVSDTEIKDLMGQTGVQDTYFSDVNEENELPDTEYTPEEAAKIQAQQPLPSQSTQEQFLSEDDSEATPAIGAIQDFEKQESERQEFEDRYTSDELAQMSEEDAAPASVRNAKTKFEQQQLTNDTENKERVPGKIRRRKEPEQIQPNQGTGTEEATPSGILQKQEEVTPIEKPKRVRTKPEVDPDQARKDQVVKYQGQLVNIVKEKKPGKKLARLKILNERTLGLPEVNQQVQAEIQKLQDRTSAQTLEKETKNLTTKEKIQRIRDRVSPEDTDTSSAFETMANLSELSATPTEEQWTQFEQAYHAASNKGTFSTEAAELKNIYNRVKKEYDKALQPVREEQSALAEAAKQEQRTQQGTKDSYLTAVAKAVAIDNPVAIKKSISDYLAWRKDKKLPLVDKQGKTIDSDHILKQASAEYYQEKADKEIKKEAEEQATLERQERAKKQKAQKKAEADKATKKIKKQFGLDEDSDVKLLDAKSEIPKEVREFVTGVEKVTLNDLFNRIQKLYANVKFLQGFDQLLNLAKAITDKFYKNGLEIFLVDDFTIARGANFNDLKNNRQVIIIPRSEFADTDAHELIHFLARAIVASIAIGRGVREGSGRSLNRMSGREFMPYLAAANELYRKLDQIHSKVLEQYRDLLTQIGRKFSNHEELSAKEVNFLTVLSSYLERRGKEEYGAITTQKQTQALIDDTFDAMGRTITYGLHDSDEMMAEALSNPYFMTLMSLFEAPELTKTTKPQSAFRAIVQGLKELLTGFYRLTRQALPKVSYLDHLLEHMSDMERYLEEIPDKRNDAAVITSYVSADNLIRENSALYMAMGGTNKPLNPLTGELRNLINYIANAWYKREDIVSLEGVEQELEKINTKTTKNKFGDAEAKLVWKKIQKYRQKVVDAKTMQTNALEYAKTSMRDYYNSHRAFRRDINDFASVDMDQLTLAQVAILEQGLLDLVTGASPAYRAYNLVNKYMAIEKLNNLLAQAEKYGTKDKHGNIKNNPVIFGISAAHISNPATFASVLAKYNTKAANNLFKEIYSKLISARTNTLHESTYFTDGLFDIVNKHNMSHSDFARVGMYGAIFSTQLSPTDPDYWSEVELNALRVIQNSQNKINAFEAEVYKGKIEERELRNELNIARELHDRILQRKSMDGILSRGQQELYNEFRAFITHFEGDMKRNTQGVWNADFKQQFNYFPTFALGNERLGNHNQQDELVPSDHVNNLWEALHQNKNYGQTIGRQSSFVREKQQPKNYFYDYDAMSIAHKFAPSVLFDLYATRELKILNQLLNGTNNNPISSGGKTIDAVISRPAVKGLNKQIKSIVGGVTMYDEGLTRAYRFVQQLKNNTATALLGTTGQFLVQTSSAIPAAIMMAPTGFARALGVVTGIERGNTHSALKEAMDRLVDKGASITIRDILFERWDTIEDKNKKGFARVQGTWKARADQATTWMLRNGDKFAARLVWFSEFFAQGGNINNPSEEHIMAAERAVGVLQNMSDVAFSAPFLRTNNQAVRILNQMLYAFQSFALNAALNLYYGTKYSFTTNNKEARQVMMASILMAASYNAVNTYLVRPAYNAAANKLFGTDDDDDDDKNYTKAQEFGWATAWDLLMGQWAPDVVEGAAKLGLVKVLKKKAESNLEDFDAHRDVPLYIPKDENEILAQGAGIYGDVAMGMFDLGAATYEAMDKMNKGEELEPDEIMIDGIRTMLMFNRLVPLRGDMQKLLRNYERHVKAEARAIKKIKSTGEGVETGTEFDTPSYELPEYDIDIPEDPTQIPE